MEQISCWIISQLIIHELENNISHLFPETNQTRQLWNTQRKEPSSESHFWHKGEDCGNILQGLQALYQQKRIHFDGWFAAEDPKISEEWIMNQYTHNLEKRAEGNSYWFTYKWGFFFLNAFFFFFFSRRGSMLSTAIFVYAATSPVNGYFGGSLYARQGGKFISAYFFCYGYIRIHHFHPRSPIT